MLQRLAIQNLAIIDAVTLDFDSGFSALTGETGAGKSILIDALGLLMGARADTQLVRSGRERADVSGEFSLKGRADLQGWLEAQECLDADDPQHLLLRRVVYAEGRTRAFINGQPVNLNVLRELGEQLIEIFGQSESQTLLKPEIQRALLDDYAGHEPLLDAARGAAERVQQVERDIAALRIAAAQDPAQVEFLRFQVRELEALKLGENEIEQLDQEHRRLANAQELLADGQTALELLTLGDSSADAQLGQALALLAGLSALDGSLEEALQLATTAQAQAREAADGLRRALDRLDAEPDRLDQLERRLQAIHDIARKHRVKPADLPALMRTLDASLQGLEGAAGQLDALEIEHKRALDHYRSAATALHESRQAAAERLSSSATDTVRPLGMAHARFEIRVLAEDPLVVRPHGNDEVRFDFSANPGQAPRPLARVASGGELSRVSLALQVVALQHKGVGTLVFDEVDAGISGAVADIVGQQLQRLGTQRQVFCVTHLAQVAAQADRHYAIRKRVEDGETYTEVEALSEPQRVDELARMQGGTDVGAAARRHAAELRRRAQR
jgi:DNA repair protein RecN (Recombination protein N)